MICLEGFLILHLCKEDEVKVCALRVAVGHMGRHNGVRQRMADLAHIKVNLLHIGPVDGTLQGIGGDAEVHERITQIRVVKASLFPALRDIAGQRQAAVLESDLADILCDIL